MSHQFCSSSSSSSTSCDNCPTSSSTTCPSTSSSTCKRCPSSSSSSSSSSSTCSSSSCSTLTNGYPISCSSSSSSSSFCDSSCSDVSTCGSTCPTEECCSESALGKKKFIITFGPKCGHRYEEDIPGNTAIYVNGKLAPILKMKRGYDYYFIVKQDKCGDDYENFFVLTESPIGKYGCLPPIPLKCSFAPISSGCARFRATSKTPKYFYYQSSSGSFMGNLIICK